MPDAPLLYSNLSTPNRVRKNNYHSIGGLAIIPLTPPVASFVLPPVHSCLEESIKGSDS